MTAVIVPECPFCGDKSLLTAYQLVVHMAVLHERFMRLWSPDYPSLLSYTKDYIGGSLECFCGFKGNCKDMAIHLASQRDLTIHFASATILKSL